MNNAELVAQQFKAGSANQVADIWGSYRDNVKVYGATGNGTTDDTDAIQWCIDTVDSGRIVFPAGEYLISKRGTRLLTYSNTQRGYGLLLLNKKNVTIEFEPGAVLKMSVADADAFNGIWIEGCENVDVIGAAFKGFNTTSSLILEEGTGITVTQSKKINIERPHSENLRGGARAYNSSDVRIAGGFASIYTNQHSSAHFALYSSSDSTIDDCSTYGATRDGDIFIYGGGSKNSTISNCRAHAYVYGDATKAIFFDQGQGIMVDSGGRDCKILDCYAYGYYFGFDMKNNSEGGVIKGCTAEKCKIGVSGRRGDGGGVVSPIAAFSVLDNTVIPNGGNGNTVPPIGSITQPIAIMIQDCYGGANVSGNMMYNSMDVKDALHFYGLIIGLSEPASEGEQGGYSITNNTFAFENRFDQLAGINQQQAILLTTSHVLIGVKISNNYFDLPQGGSLKHPIEVYNTQGLSITDNTFTSMNASGFPMAKLTNCLRVNMSNNTFSYHYGLLECFNCKGVSFSNNVSAENIAGVGKASVLLDNSTYININGNTTTVETPFNKDDVYFIAQNGSNWINVTSNLLQLVNKNSTNWYTNTAVNISIENNVID